MKNGVILAGLDLGASSVKCVVAELHPDGVIDVIGTGSRPTIGVRSGQISRREEVASAIRKAVEEAALMAGCEIHEVHTAVGGPQMRSSASWGLCRIQSGQVTPTDIEAAVDLARAVPMPEGQTVLHVVPREYIVDGEGGIVRPEGLSGVRLEVKAHLVSGPESATRELEACCEAAGLRVADVVFAPLAAARALLTHHDRELGVVVIDVGGGTTNVAVFQGGTLMHASVIPVGGDHITSDVRDCLHTPSVEAERLKQQHGCALTTLVDHQEEVEVPGAGGRKPRLVRRTLLSEIIEARMAEILAIVAEDLSAAGFQDGLPGGVILTGGTSAMEGVTELTEEVLGMPTTQGQPTRVKGLVDVVKNPRYATGTGLVVSAAHAEDREWFTPGWAPKSPGLMEKIKGWMPW